MKNWFKKGKKSDQKFEVLLDIIDIIIHSNNNIQNKDLIEGGFTIMDEIFSLDINYCLYLKKFFDKFPDEKKKSKYEDLSAKIDMWLKDANEMKKVNEKMKQMILEQSKKGMIDYI